MAAETIAIELVNILFQKLADEAFKRIARSQGIHKELNELGSTLSRIQDLLNDASQKEVSDKSVKKWLNGLQHLAYDIDDVLDDLATEAMHRELTLESGATTSKVRKLIPTCCTNFSLSHRLLPKLDSITTELQRLEKQKSDVGLISVKDEKPKDTSRRNETSLPDVSTVVGREVEIEKLLNKLLGDEPSKENFSILPIVGMGGVGKTTLARLLYNNPKVNDHFQLKTWVCISDDFDVFKISDIILQSVTKENKEFKDFNQLQMALTQQFQDKRFLIVVDDVWSENYDEWENLVRPFHSGAPESRIIMTTRKEQLLIKLGFGHLDHLESLSPKGALSLLALHALDVDDNFDSHTTLKPCAEGIVKKCAGLPLAIKAIGRLLRTKAHREDWDYVLNSEIWDINDGDVIVPALKLSYHEISADLKRLFAYCSLFPKDFLFDKEELVLLWMGEGFLNTSKSPERLGREYFEILLSRSFFQRAPNDESLFTMHDLMNDLATFVAAEIFLRFDSHVKIEKGDLVKHRHMSFIREEYVGYQKFEAFKGARSLRTLLAVSMDQSLKHSYLSNKILVDLIPKLPLLRVVSLSGFEISEVPGLIGSLKHLRYLNLSQTNISELSEDIGNLYNLETLIVFGCRLLTKLPKSFLKLKKLRHFDIRNTPLLEKLPLGTGELRSLQTLTRIIIEGGDAFAITKIKDLKYLHGKASIEGLHKVQSAMHARVANLSIKRITELELKWADVFDGSRRGTLEKEVLDELKPDSDGLKELAIVSYGGIEYSNWVGDPSFHQLVNVSIHECRKCTYLPPLGQLSSLQKLSIRGMDEVKFIGLELSGSAIDAFPSLETLSFEDMSGWEVWSTDCKVLFPCLQKLRIENCPNLVNVSLKALPLLKNLEISTCGDGVLRSVVEVASLITSLKIVSISGLTNKVWRGVIGYLGTVEEISMVCCNEIRYLWESEAMASKVLVNLKTLNLYQCDNLVSLGEREEDNFRGNLLLSSLTGMSVWKCESMKHVWCPNSNSIENLIIDSCDNMERVFFPTTGGGGGGGEGGGQKLKSLCLSDFSVELMEKINNTSMPMLETVYISGFKNLKSINKLINFIHLTHLFLLDCPSMESFPDLQLKNLTLLKSLCIIKCPNIDDSFPRGLWPPKLVMLGIGGLKKPILEWGHQNFPASLVDLTLVGEPNVRNFSALSHLLPLSLTEISIQEFDEVESLSVGLQHLTSLQHLEIEKCPKMKHLPETLLPSLLSLQIKGCPNLKERCNGRGSHYWPHISHIPRINITDR
ncbi:hypothetical protein SSX86_006517 [Deinandra increscens subsp. villosa]|uniref:NB-ARC n=1 Tax=Deinandra increscens subsp. villosa TaxID=3103831 RepID=A0AAP0DJ11_9ASTR